MGHAHKIALRALQHQKVDREREIPTSDDEQIPEYVIDRQGDLDESNAKAENTLASERLSNPQTISTATTIDNPVNSPSKFLPESGELTNLSSGTKPPASGNQHIYLVRPMTRGSEKVMIPINSDTKLRDALMNREVVEFPTFHVLSQPPGSLPSPFILEQDYLEKFNIQQEEMRRLVASGTLSRSKKQPDVEDQPTFNRMSNADDLLAILQRDIQGV